jgi:hypothetical protein
MTWRIVVEQEPIISPFFLPFLTDGMPQSFQMVDINSKIH